MDQWGRGRGGVRGGPEGEGEEGVRGGPVGEEGETLMLCSSASIALPIKQLPSLETRV